MTYYITALTNDRARLIVSESRTTSKDLAHLMVEALKSKGYIVRLYQEG